MYTIISLQILLKYKIYNIPPNSGHKQFKNKSYYDVKVTKDDHIRLYLLVIFYPN